MYCLPLPKVKATSLWQFKESLCLQDNLGAIDYLCIVAKVVLLVQKEDNS